MGTLIKLSAAALAVTAVAAAATFWFVCPCANIPGGPLSGEPATEPVAVERPGGVIRIGNTLYPVNLTRLTQPAALDVAWSARLQKLGGQKLRRPDHWWSFQLRSTGL